MLWKRPIAITGSTVEIFIGYTTFLQDICFEYLFCIQFIASHKIRCHFCPDVVETLLTSNELAALFWSNPCMME
jgi:hypothetical protein